MKEILNNLGKFEIVERFNISGLFKIEKCYFLLLFVGSNFPVINSSYCEFPFTYNGGLFYKCSDSLPLLNNLCNKFFCLSRTRVLSICSNPSGNALFHLPMILQLVITDFITFVI